MFGFINDLIAIDGRNEFENHYHEIYPQELISKKKHISCTETAFLDLHFHVKEGRIQTSLYDIRNFCNFNVVRFQYKSSTIPLKMLFCDH